VQAPPLKGGEVVCNIRHPPLLQCNIRHIANKCVMVLRLKGFIFFASAQQMAAWVQAFFEREYKDSLPAHRRVQWIIFDCEQLDGLDSSASKCMAKLMKAAQAAGVKMVWSTMSRPFRVALERCDTIKSKKDWFDTLDDAIQYTHNKIAERIVLNQFRWSDMSSSFEAARAQAYARLDNDPFARILPLDEQRFGCPWSYCGRIELKAYETILWKPGTCKDLFLVCSGQIALFKSIPHAEGGDEHPAHSPDNFLRWGHAQTIYTQGWFLNRQAVFNHRSRDYAVALRDGEVLFWNELQWARMKRERPRMANAIMKAVLAQEHSESDRLELAKNSLFGRMTASEPIDIFSAKTDIGSVSTAIKQEADATYEMREEIQGLKIALALEEIGLFDPVEASEEIQFPKLPTLMSEDIDIAFSTYAKTGSANAVETLMLPVEQLPFALMYVGIYGAVLNDVSRESFTRNEFLVICRRALLTSMSKTVSAKLIQRFREHCEKEHATMDRSDLVNLLKELFQCDIPADEVDGIANMWGVRYGNRIDEDSFLAVVARFVSRHMKDWLIVKGARDLMGDHFAMNDGSPITEEMLVKARPSITPEVAEEMIWSASYCAGLRRHDGIDYRMLGAILRTAPPKPQQLPMCKPRRLSTDGQIVAEQVHIDIDSHQAETDSAQISPWLRDILADFRKAEVETEPKSPHPSKGTSRGVMKRKFSAQTFESETVASKIPKTCAAKVWLLLDVPESSRFANNVSLAMGMLILVSVFTLFLEPLSSPKNKERSDLEETTWFVVEAFFTAIFTIEYLMKLITCTALGTQTRCQFLKQPMNICDVIAVLPFYIDISIDTDQEEFRLFRIARLMRLSRLVRLGRLAKRSATFAPIAMILVVIWGIYMKNGLKE